MLPDRHIPDRAIDTPRMLVLDIYRLAIDRLQRAEPDLPAVLLVVEKLEHVGTTLLTLHGDLACVDQNHAVGSGVVVADQPFNKGGFGDRTLAHVAAREEMERI